MKYILAILVIILQPISAYAVDVFSANGFTCVNLDTFVKCEGRFPGTRGMFAAIGKEPLTILYADSPKSYSYQSFTGCLLESSEGKVVATNRQGMRKAFRGIEGVGDFCKASREQDTEVK